MKWYNIIHLLPDGSLMDNVEDLPLFKSIKEGKIKPQTKTSKNKKSYANSTASN